VQTSESSTNGDTTEAGLCDGSIDNPLGTEAVEQTLSHLVSVEGGSSASVWIQPDLNNYSRSVVLRNFLTEDEGLLVGFQLLR
jgi:hypothetical protein